MADTPRNDGESEPAAYELQVYALSPVAPSPRRLVAEAEAGGVAVALEEWDGASPEDEGWTTLVLRAGAQGSGPRIRISTPEVLDEQIAGFREDREDGEEIPESLFSACRLFLVELEEGGEPDEDGDEDEESEAAFVLSAWALASLTEGLVFDPQEEFFADADSFLALLMDEEAAEAPGAPIS